MDIPIILSFIDDNGKHLRHGVIDTFDTTIAIWVVRTGGDLADAKKFVDSLR